MADIDKQKMFHIITNCISLLNCFGNLPRSLPYLTKTRRKFVYTLVQTHLGIIKLLYFEQCVRPPPFIFRPWFSDHQAFSTKFDYSFQLRLDLLFPFTFLLLYINSILRSGRIKNQITFWSLFVF